MNGLNAYAKAYNEIGGFGYVYGAQGEIITPEILKTLRNKYGSCAPGGPSYYEENRVLKWIGKQCFDCSGLIMWFMQKMNIYTYDKNANYIMSESLIVNHPQPGDLSFKLDGLRAVHVGIYIGDGYFIHARGTDYGVVETGDEYKWDVYGRIEVPQVHWAEPYYQYLKENGIMYSDKRYEDNLTRGDYFAAKAKELEV